MQQFIKLTQPDGDKVSLKISQIEIILENKEKAETFVSLGNSRVTVLESFEEIEKLIIAQSVYH